TGGDVVWKSADSRSQQVLATVSDLNWKIAVVGDFNGDGQADILWRNGSTGANVIWRSANSQTQQALTAVTDLNWHIVD
ncbi:MAG TPA: hypothetical protein VLM17_04840, partial [Xanthomonadaceae bacterium]|nr:hypothetical protein [Xanthomonadaceae bacterium]